MAASAAQRVAEFETEADVTADLEDQAAPGKWYVVCTRPNAELRVRDALLVAKLTAFAPVEKHVRRCRSGRTSRRTETLTPVFPRYVFVRAADLSVFDQVREIDGTMGVLGGKGDDGKFHAWAIPSKDVVKFRLSEAAGLFDFTPKVRSIGKGELVKVTKGPFLGYKARYNSTDADPKKRASDRVEVLMQDLDGRGGEWPTRIRFDHLEALD